MATVAIVGCGAAGTRAARHLLRGATDTSLVLVDAVPAVAEAAAVAVGDRDRARAERSVPGDCAVALLATASEDQVGLAREHVSSGRTVVACADGIDSIRAMLELDDAAQRAGATLVIGAGMMPGLSDVLAFHASAWFDRVDEVHVAKFGTGGPDCAREHHRALSGFGHDWRDGRWVRRAGGSGRELSWFPPPVQAADCYRAALGDPLLLARVHPNAVRITARMAATRRDRLTMHLPMLRRPHPEGLLGAVRVELRGVREGARHEIVLGCAERPAVAAGAVAATATIALLAEGAPSPGAKGLAEVVDPIDFLHQLRRRGLRPEIFVGSDHTVSS